MSKGSELAVVTLDDKLATLDPATLNILNPVITFQGESLAQYLEPTISYVKVDPGPDSGETYHDWRFAPPPDPEKHKEGKYALTSLALNKVSKAAGVQWLLEHCHKVEPHHTYQGELAGRSFMHERVTWQAAAAVRLPNGDVHVEMKSKTIDTGRIAEKLWDDDLRSIEKGFNKNRQGRVMWTEEDIPNRVRQQVMQIREHLESLAETKAQNRVLKSILGLKQAYTEKELAKPFAVPRLVYRPEAAVAIAEGRRARAELYGGESRVPTLRPPTPPESTSSSTEQEETPAPGSSGESEGGATVQRPRQEDAAKDEAPSSGPELPKADPLLDEILGGSHPHKGKRMSEVAETDPGFLQGLAASARRKETRELAQAWLSYTQPTQQQLGGGS